MKIILIHVEGIHLMKSMADVPVHDFHSIAGGKEKVSVQKLIESLEMNEQNNRKCCRLLFYSQ